MAERGKRKFFAEAGGADDLLHDFAEVPEILFFGDPRKRCAAPAVCVVPPEDEAGDRGLLDLVKLGISSGKSASPASSTILKEVSIESSDAGNAARLKGDADDL